MSEDQNQQNEEQAEERKLKDPRTLSKRPPSRAAKEGPEHVRVQEHGIRSTAQTQDELRREAHEENIREDFKRTEGRTTGAGPNPYELRTSREQAGAKAIKALLKERDENELDNSLLSERALAAHAASAGESNAADAEVQTLGATITETGQKIVEKPDRVDAQERAVLPIAGTPHEEATAESDSDLAADKNPGAVFGGNVQEQTS